jgi:protein-tyrosine phosphatase
MRNFRDVGGVPVADGRSVATGRLFRGEALLARLDSPDDDVRSDRVKAAAIRSVVDLRTVAEQSSTPTVWSTDPAVSVTAAPVTDPAGFAGRLLELVGSGSVRSYTREDLGTDYRRMVDDQAPAMGAAVSAVAQALPGPVLVHCAGGKDRTGLVVALILELVGVERSAIAADYALTARLLPGLLKSLRPVLVDVGVPAEDIAGIFSAEEPTILATLQHLEDVHGGVRAYLEGPAAVPPEQLDRLQELLVVS